MTEIAIRNLEIGDAGWVIEQHALEYAASPGFDASFEAVVADILAGYIRAHDPSRERAFIALRGNERLGSIFCVRSDRDDVAKLRLFLILTEARGTGLGKRLLSECLSFARSVGYRKMTLWTQQSQVAACGLYARVGFRCVASQHVHVFGVDAVDQTWEIDL